MANIDKVKEYVSEIYPKAICDDCLAKKLAFSKRQMANQISRHLSSEYNYERVKRNCHFCLDAKLSISAKNKVESPTFQTNAILEPKPVTVSVPKLGLKSILDVGFRKVGQWVLDAGRLDLQLIKDENIKPALYAFVSSGEVLYVGKTVRMLKRRLYHYGKPGATQQTNIRVNELLTKYLTENRVIEIFAFSNENVTTVGAFVVDLPAALEGDIIRKIQPIWNVR